MCLVNRTNDLMSWRANVFELIEAYNRQPAILSSRLYYLYVCSDCGLCLLFFLLLFISLNVVTAVCLLLRLTSHDSCNNQWVISLRITSQNNPMKIFQWNLVNYECVRLFFPLRLFCTIERKLFFFLALMIVTFLYWSNCI